MQQWNDAELLSAYANRQSEEAFGVLVERHIALVYSAAARQAQNPQLAEEVTQATFTILAQKARRLSGRATLSGWLCRTAHFVARNALKTELRRHYREKEARMQSLFNEPRPETWREFAPLLDEAVAQLNEADRSAIVLRFFERKSLNEVGDILKVAPDTAQKRVSRALEKLRKFFAGRGINSTTAVIAENISAHSIQAVPMALSKSVTAAALAKGAAASASTLTLIKGASKIMAWTKAKTAVVAATVALLAIGATTLTIITIPWLEHQRKGYTIHCRVEQNAQGYSYIWTVRNWDQSWGLVEFVVEVPDNTRVLTNTVPASFSTRDGGGYWIMQQTRDAQVDPNDGMVWLPPAKPGKKWILWSGQQSPSVYPSNTVATFSITTDAAVKPGTVEDYAVTYTPQNDPHYYHAFHSKVKGPAD